MGESRSGCVADDCSFYDVKRGALRRVSGTNRHRMQLHRGLAHRQMRGASLAGDFHFSDAVHVGPSPSYAERQFCDFDHCPSSAGAAASVSQSRHREAFSVWTGMHWNRSDYSVGGAARQVAQRKSERCTKLVCARRTRRHLRPGLHAGSGGELPWQNRTLLAVSSATSLELSTAGPWTQKRM